MQIGFEVRNYKFNYLVSAIFNLVLNCLTWLLRFYLRGIP